MRSCSVFACTLVGASAVAAITSDTGLVADSPKPQKQLRFLLLTETEDQVKAVPFDQDQPIPKNGTLVTCDRLRISSDDIVFEKAVIETEDQKTTAMEAIFALLDASIKFSDDFSISFKNSKGKKDLLNALTR